MNREIDQKGYTHNNMLPRPLDFALPLNEHVINLYLIFIFKLFIGMKFMSSSQHIECFLHCISAFFHQSGDVIVAQSVGLDRLEDFDFDKRLL